MTDEAETSLALRLKTFGASIVGAFTPLGAVLLGADPATAALAGVAAQAGADAVLGSVGQAVKARAEAAGRELFIEIKARLDATDDAEERRRIVEEYAADPKRDDLLMEGWKVLFSAPDPATWPALRRLAIDYWSAARAPDGFYRDTSAMLAACVADDIVAIRVLLASADKAMLFPMPRGARNRMLNARWPSARERDTALASVNPKRAIKLLVAHGFGGDGGGDRLRFARQEHEPLRRLALLLD